MYAQVATSDNFKIGARYEFFNDKNTVWEFAETNASDFTLSANYSIGNLTIIPEIRIDTNDENVFLDADGEATDGLASFVLAFTYGF